MPVKQPGKVLLHRIPLKFVRERVGVDVGFDVDVAVVIVLVDVDRLAVVFLCGLVLLFGFVVTSKAHTPPFRPP
jgi:uncharacterized membrane protein YGL010W